MSNKEINVLDKNFCFSNVLKEIDLRLKFKDFKEEKSLYILNQLKKEKRERLRLLQRKYNNNEILFNLKKAYEENRILLNIKGKYINDETNKKEEKLPNLANKSKNEKNPDKKVDNNLISEDKKEPPAEFENTWKEEYFKRLREKNSNRDSNKITIETDSENKNDIFDKNFRKMKQKKSEKKLMIEKIKENNLKVKIKLKSYKELMEKFSERKEYSPNYIILEKHVPVIRLDSNSKRIFPYKFIKMHNYSNEKKIFKKKLFKNNSYQNFYKNNFIINPCSLFNSSIKSNSLMSNSIYSTISKSNINNDNSNTFFSKGFRTKNSGMFEKGNIIYKF
jgi:hypothetical protein